MCFDLSLASFFWARGSPTMGGQRLESLSSRKQDIGHLGSALNNFSRVSSIIFFFVKSQVHRFSFVKGLLFSCFVQMFCQVHLQCVFVLLIHSLEQAYRPFLSGIQMPERNRLVRLSFNCPQVHFDKCFFYSFIGAFLFFFFYSGQQVPHSAVTSFSLCAGFVSSEVFFFFVAQSSVQIGSGLPCVVSIFGYSSQL